MNKKPGFIYIFSKALNQEIAMSEKTGTVYCEDGTKYTKDEIVLISKIYGEIPLSVHTLKKQFGGSTIESIMDKTNETEEIK